VPLEFALEIIAAIIVEAATSPIFPSSKIIMNPTVSIICNPVIKINRITITRFKAKVSVKLNSNLPRNISDEPAESFKASEVSFSSSLINTLESPLDAEKKIAIHNKPARTSFDTVSFPIEKRIIEIITITNIKREFITYLFRISEIKSFFKI
jgi:hypothetical protein